MDSEKKNKIVALPQFKKKLELTLENDVNVMMQFELNWKEYIKGVKFVKD